VAHCPPELLNDVADVIAEVRGWPDVVERKPGVFYARRRPFLHFHLFEGVRRRADVRGRSAWISIDLPRPVTATKRRELLRELRRQYRERGVSDRAGRRRPRRAR
jgi:hypothetical protein